MTITLSGITIEVPEGAKIDVSEDGKTVRIVPAEAKVIEKIRVVEIPGSEKVVEKIRVVERPCDLPHYPCTKKHYPDHWVYPYDTGITWRSAINNTYTDSCGNQVTTIQPTTGSTYQFPAAW